MVEPVRQQGPDDRLTDFYQVAESPALDSEGPSGSPTAAGSEDASPRHGRSGRLLRMVASHMNAGGLGSYPQSLLVRSDETPSFGVTRNNRRHGQKAPGAPHQPRRPMPPQRRQAHTHAGPLQAVQPANSDTDNCWRQTCWRWSRLSSDLLDWLFLICWRNLLGPAARALGGCSATTRRASFAARCGARRCRIHPGSAASCLRRPSPDADRRSQTTHPGQGQATGTEDSTPAPAAADEGASAGAGAHRAGRAGRTRRAYRRPPLTLRPAKLVPLNPEHEQQALAALTELLRALLAQEQHPHRA